MDESSLFLLLFPHQEIVCCLPSPRCFVNKASALAGVAVHCKHNSYRVATKTFFLEKKEEEKVKFSQL